MKLSAEQQARLDDLRAREESLTASEKAELDFLASLEAQAAADAGEESAPEAEAEETPDAGAESAGPPDPPSPAAKKPSIFERAAAVVQSRSALLADLAQVREQLAAVTAERDSLAAQIDDLRQRAEAGEAFAERVAELESERHTVSQAAARIAASSHVAPEDLPETSQDEVETLDSVREALASAKDPKERSRLAKKARELRNAAALN